MAESDTDDDCDGLAQSSDSDISSNDGHFSDTDSDSSSGDDAEVAAENFADILVDMVRRREVSSHRACVLSHYATGGGLIGSARSLVKAPGDKGTGHYKRHFERQVGDESSEFDYIFKVPGHNIHTRVRGPVTVVGYCAHEMLRAEWESDSHDVEFVRRLDRNTFFPQVYWDHPLTDVEGKCRAVPGSIFIDGVPYSNVDGVVGVWIHSNISKKRHLLLSIRKRLFCRCGCRGWCTMHAVFLWLAWTLKCLVDGWMPEERHDGEPWLDSDAGRAILGGSSLGGRLCCTYRKCDWMEVATTYGFHSHSHSIRPCFTCNCHPGNMHSYEGISALALPWLPNELGDYEAACSRAERFAVLETPQQRDRLAALLEYQKFSREVGGRVLRCDMPEHRLLKGDRLEPFVGLLDIGALELIIVFPFRAVF